MYSISYKYKLKGLVHKGTASKKLNMVNHTTPVVLVQNQHGHLFVSSVNGVLSQIFVKFVIICHSYAIVPPKPVNTIF
jgi:hypothetical protein